MSLVKTRSLASIKLQNNYNRAIVLSLLVIFTYLTINFMGAMSTIFLSTLLLEFKIVLDTTVASAVITVCFSLLILSPLRLNIKLWYQLIEGQPLSLPTAFSYFCGFKQYLSAVYFCIVRLAVVFVTFLLPMSPSMFIAGILLTAFDLGNSATGPAFGVLFIIMMILFILGLFASVVVVIGFFYTDYLYINGIQCNPFKALIQSQKISKYTKKRILSMICALLPYYILCLGIVTIPFYIPKIRAKYAVYIDESLQIYY